ncbi:monooxygenase [Virgisporangium aurantiacum]|uniref:Monooxygenase n=2 Tax=Virgisporangium aurantiacum TaxID=175570 RepID=A0A8J3ZFA3_9ACTN|nr:monooxygenase [Virgisporangium aurantiacum]
MLALLLARQGRSVIVLEKHADFLRDFRGDTVHPSTLDVLADLGLMDKLAALPHRLVRQLRFTFADRTVTVADFSRLRCRHPYVMFLPQWDFLELLGSEGTFTLLREHEVVGLVRTGGAVGGVVARTPSGEEVEIRAPLTVAADGRHSAVRRLLDLRPKEFGAPMDVLWFRLPRESGDRDGVDVRVGSGHLLISIDRGDYWQCGLVVPKGGYEAIGAAGLPAFRETLAGLAPSLRGRLHAIGQWDDVRKLTVRVNRLRRWYADGVLLIGDAAHAMSPVGAVGINLAIQDAVAAARLLAGPLARGRVTTRDLARVQRRRVWPTRVTQLGQRVAQRAVVRRALATSGPVRSPAPTRLLDRFPALQAVPARIVGIGVRPERVS